MKDTIETESTTPEKLMRLYMELIEAKRNKKDVNKAASDEVKRIEEEIEDLLEQELEKQEELEALADKDQ